MTINEFAAEVHKNAVDHGWWDGERTFPEIVAFVAKRTEARIAEAALTIRKIRTPVVPRRAKSPKGSRRSLPT